MLNNCYMCEEEINGEDKDESSIFLHDGKRYFLCRECADLIEQTIEDLQELFFLDPLDPRAIKEGEVINIALKANIYDGDGIDLIASRYIDLTNERE